MTGPVGRYEHWSVDEDNLLRSMLHAGKGVMLSALKLKRRQGSVKSRAQRLGISIKDGRPLKTQPTLSADP